MLHIRTLVQYPVGGRDHGMKDGSCEGFAEVNIKNFRSCTFLYLQRIGLRLIGDEIASFADAAGLAVHRAKAIAP